MISIPHMPKDTSGFPDASRDIRIDLLSLRRTLTISSNHFSLSLPRTFSVCPKQRLLETLDIGARVGVG